MAERRIKDGIGAERLIPKDDALMSKDDDRVLFHDERRNVGPYGSASRIALALTSYGNHPIGGRGVGVGFLTMPFTAAP